MSVDGDSQEQSRTDFDLYYNNLSSGGPRANVVTDLHSDISYLLGIAQDRQIDFIPIKWQPALDKIGGGGTAEIRQSLINLQMSFAFKRPRESLKRLKTKREALAPSISEISVLGHPRIRSHPHIVRLEAICWDISDTNDADVWPVLVFEKSQCGDLQRFLTSGEGLQLGVDQRLKLCYHVASALSTIHSCRIIHGDVKPANFLAFREDQSFVAKLADFGYSAHFKGSEFIRLAESRPFNAPEYQHGGFQFDGARKRDIFSLGMSCLWILFHDVLQETVGSANQFHVISRDTLQDPWKHGLLGQLKQEKALEAFGRLLVHQDPNLSGRQKVALSRFLELALAHDPQERELNMAMLVELLGYASPSDLKLDKSIVSSHHRDFSIAKGLPRLYMADYRVRKYIAEALKLKPRLHLCTECALNDSKQLAFCYSIGFGVPRDEEKALQILGKIGENRAYLDQEVEIARAAPFEYINQKLVDLESLGFLNAVDHVHEYQRRETLDAVEKEFQREIEDVAIVFGNNDAFTVHLKLQLTRIIMGRGDYDRAERLLLGLQDLFEDLPDSASNMTFPTMLASIYDRQGRYDKAETCYRQALESGRRVDGERNQNTQVCMNNLATVLLTRGKYKEAEEMKRAVLEEWQHTLGEEHPRTLMGMLNLAAVLEASGDMKALDELISRAHRGLVRVLGVDHPDTLSSLINLGAIQRGQGKYDAAEKSFLQVVTTRRRLFGENHPDTLMAVNSLAMVLYDQGRYKEAEENTQRALEGMKAILSEEHADTWQLLENVAVMSQNVGKYSEAADAYRHALKAVGKMFGKDHPRALNTARHLALAISDLGKHAEAEVMGRQLLEKSKQVLGDRHPDYLATVNNLALTLGRQRKYRESENLHRQAVEGRRDILGEKHPDTLVSYHNLASILAHQQQYEEGEQLHRKVLAGRSALFGEQHPDTLDTVSDLAAIDFFKRRYGEAEDGYQRALKGYEAVFGEAHPRTLTVVSNLGLVFHHQRKFEDAERMHRRALAGRTQLLGSDHPETLSSKNNLNATLLSLGQYSAAEVEARDALKGHQRLYGLEHPSTLSNISYLATTLLYQEKYEEGARMHRQAFELRLKVLGRDHADTLASLQKLAEVLLFLGRNDEVEEAASMVLPSELLSVDAESTGEGVDPKEESFVMSAPTQGDEEMVAESGLSPDHILSE